MGKQHKGHSRLHVTSWKRNGTGNRELNAISSLGGYRKGDHWVVPRNAANPSKAIVIGHDARAPSAWLRSC